MPRPAYIICSESGSIDHRTNQLSTFNVLEAIDVSPVPPLPPKDDLAGLKNLLSSLGGVKVRITAAWMRDAADSLDTVFETEIVGLDPEGDTIFRASSADFSFAKPFHRVNASLKMPGFPSLGVYLIEARLRQKGDADWTWRQSFPVLVKAKDPETPQEQIPSLAAGDQKPT
jgi:hypothetical protein